MLWKQLPDELDTSALSLVYDIWKDGGITDKPAAALAAFNVAGFATEKVLGQPVALSEHAPDPDADDAAETHEAFQAAMGGGQRASGRVASTAVGFGGWALILKVALAVLRQLLA